MIREVDLKSYLPVYLLGYKELDNLLMAATPEVQRLEDATETFLNNQFILSTDKSGISRFEQMLKIIALDTDTLEERQFRVVSKWNQSIPYTKGTLKEKLTILCGEDGYKMDVDTENKVLMVRVELKSKKSLNDVGVLLENVVPYNMIINLSLLYNQHSTLSRFTHAQLSKFTHNQLRNEVLKNGN